MIFKKEKLKIIGNYFFQGSRVDFEKEFYMHVAKGEVGYARKGILELFSSEKRMFVGRKTLDNKGNFRLHLRGNSSPFAGYSDILLELTEDKNGLNIKAITKPVDGYLTFISGGILLFPLGLIFIAWRLIKDGLGLAIIPITLLFSFVFVLNYKLMQDNIKELNTTFNQHFLTWENVEKIT